MRTKVDEREVVDQLAHRLVELRVTAGEGAAVALEQRKQPRRVEHLGAEEQRRRRRSWVAEAQAEVAEAGRGGGGGRRRASV